MGKMYRYQRYDKKKLSQRSLSGDSILMASDIIEESKRYKEKKTLRSKFYYDEDCSLYYAYRKLNDHSDCYDIDDSNQSCIEKVKKEKKTNIKKTSDKPNLLGANYESKKTTYLSHIIVMTLFSSPFAFYAYDYNPVFTYIIAFVVGFFLFSLGIYSTKKILKLIFSRPNKRIKLELKNTSQLLNLISKDSNLTNNLILSQKMHDQITINELLIDNVDKISSIDLVVINQKLKNALSAIDDNCLNEMKVIL